MLEFGFGFLAATALIGLIARHQIQQLKLDKAAAVKTAAVLAARESLNGINEGWLAAYDGQEQPRQGSDAYLQAHALGRRLYHKRHDSPYNP